MAQLRKMLGAVDEPSVVALMRLMETQSKTTLAAWAAGYVKENLLPLLSECGDPRPAAAVEAVLACVRGERTVKEIRPAMTAARNAGRELTATPVIQAAARAVGTACAVLLTPTNALGWVFYDAAAVVYRQGGADMTREEQDDMASEEIARILEVLRAAAIPDEKEPVRLDWGC